MAPSGDVSVIGVPAGDASAFGTGGGSLDVVCNFGTLGCFACAGVRLSGDGALSLGGIAFGARDFPNFGPSGFGLSVGILGARACSRRL